MAKVLERKRGSPAGLEGPDECPECSGEMEKVADWPEDWVFCTDCLHTEKMA